MVTSLILLVSMFFGVLCLDPRAEGGYSRGLMSECPGSTKPASILRSQLKYIFFVVQGKGRTRHIYTYWKAKNIATDPRIDFRRKTVVIVIGYLDSSSFPISDVIANEYERKIDCQRFTTVHYYLATRLMRPVGKHVAEVLADLNLSGLDPSKTELIGYSLGGQTISYIAKSFQQITGRKISRITSLDPSGPCFRNLPPNDRLDASDAEFVQVIHANIDGLGMATRMGHVDFYINGGEYQPSDINFFPCFSICSHFRILFIWVSLMKNPKKFIGIRCDSVQEARDAACYNKVPLITNIMGDYVDIKTNGIFYISTSKTFPYYLGEDGLKPEYAAWRTITDINDGKETEIYV